VAAQKHRNAYGQPLFCYSDMKRTEQPLLPQNRANSASLWTEVHLFGEFIYSTGQILSY